MRHEAGESHAVPSRSSRMRQKVVVGTWLGIGETVNLGRHRIGWRTNALPEYDLVAADKSEHIPRLLVKEIQIQIVIAEAPGPVF